MLPGLINTHTHAPMVLYRGLADDLALMEWLQKYIFPAEAKTVSPEFVRAGTRLAALEMIQSGTTAYADMYYFEEEIAAGDEGGRHPGRPRADDHPVSGPGREDAGGRDRARGGLRPPVEIRRADRARDRASLHVHARREDAQEHPRVRRQGAVPVIIHLAETSDEVKVARTKYKTTPTQFLESIGFFGDRTLAAHGVHLTPADIRVLAKRRVGVSHNPESNMKLASGTAPVIQMQRAGIHVGLGTDGAASNNDLDMFEAMRQAAFLHKLESHDPRALPAKTAIRMATIDGARSLGMDRELGSLEAGKRADLIVVSMRSARQTPLYDPLSHLVYVTRGDDVRTVVVNGKIVMRDRQVLTLNEQAVLDEAARLGRQSPSGRSLAGSAAWKYC